MESRKKGIYMAETKFNQTRWHKAQGKNLHPGEICSQMSFPQFAFQMSSLCASHGKYRNEQYIVTIEHLLSFLVLEHKYQISKSLSNLIGNRSQNWIFVGSPLMTSIRPQLSLFGADMLSKIFMLKRKYGFERKPVSICYCVNRASGHRTICHTTTSMR